VTTAASYEVLDRLGGGATGTVFRARSTAGHDVVAIKEVAAAVRADPAAVTRLRHEARLLLGLAHPNVVRVLDVVDEPDRFWLVLEYVEGSGLGPVLAAHGRLTPEQSLLVLRGALTGLGFAHARGVVHGDVSLDNLLLTTEGSTKVVDFGLAAPVGSSGGPAGTPAFASPEAVTGGARTPASDVYSAAAVLWTLMAGRPPFPGSDAAAVLRAHVEQPPPRLEGHGPDLAHLLDRALAKDPARRPPDAAAFLAELERAAERRYGAGWPSRASLTGLAVTTSGGLLAAAAGGTAPPAAPAVVASSLAGEAAPVSALTASPGGIGSPPPTAAISPPQIPVPRGPAPAEGPPPPQPPRNPHKGAWIAGAVTVVAVAVVVLVVVLSGGSGETPRTGTADASGNASEAHQSEPPPEPAAPAAPDGGYTKHSAVTVEDPIWDPAATGEYTIEYTFAFDCPDVPCTGSVTGPGGATFPGTTTVEFDGTTLHFENSQVVDYDCQAMFGIPAFGFVSTQVDAVGDFAVGPAAEGERPPLSGTEVTTFRPLSASGGCPLPAAGTSTRQVTFTPG
jgi:serine/threonine-protein kinase